MAYYTKKELTNIGLEGFALIDEFYGGGRRGRKQQLPNYGGRATYMVTSRPLPPPPPTPPPTTPVVAINHYSTASSSGNSRRLLQYQQGGYNYHRYSPAESRVGWTPVVAMATETTTTVIRRGYDAVKLHDAEILMDNFKY